MFAPWHARCASARPCDLIFRIPAAILPMSESPTPRQTYTAPSRQIYAWAIGSIALNALICTFGQAMNVLTVGVGMSTAVVGTAMMLPRVIDAIIDPFVGQLSDKTDTRWGRRKPFLVVGSVLASLFLFILWWGDSAWSGTTQLVFLTVIGTMFYISWGIYSMAWTALGYELTDDYNERSRIAALWGYFTALVLVVNSWVYWFALRPLFKHGVVNTLGDFFSQGMDWNHMGMVLANAFKTVEGAPTNEINGMRWITTGVVVISLASAFYSTRNCQERFARVAKGHTPIGQSLKETFKNRPFIVLMVYKLCQVFGERIFQGMLFYIGMYYVCKGDKNMATAIVGKAGSIGVFVTFLVLPTIKPISKWLGKRAGLIIPSVIALVMMLSQPWLLTPEHPHLLMIPTLMLSALSIISNSMINAIVPDICDLDELEHGERREGLFTSVVAFMGKLEISLSLQLVGLLVAFSGANMKTTIQSAAVNERLLWIAIGFGVFFSICALGAAFFFRMTEATMNDVRVKLETRRAAAKATTAGATAAPADT